MSLLRYLLNTCGVTSYKMITCTNNEKRTLPTPRRQSPTCVGNVITAFKCFYQAIEKISNEDVIL